MNDSADAIFKRAKEGRVLFSDRASLTPGFIPDRLPFRDDQIKAVAEVLAPALHGSKPSNLLLYGKTGTGKTAVARNVMSALDRQAKGQNLFTCYINTRLADTEYRTLTELALALGLPKKDVPFTGLSTGELVNRIFADIKRTSKHVILIMDEIDFLVKTFGDDVLYEFTRSAERLSPGLLSLVGISNDLQFKDELDPRVLSSLGEEEIVFPPYTVGELREILAERAALAFKKAAVTDSAINLCAAMAGSEHGDARRAVDLLRVAGEVAEREGRPHVDDVCVRRASEKVERDRVEDALRSLPVQNKIILATVSKFPEGTNTGELYLTYSSLCRKAGLEALTQRRVSGILAELDMYGLLEASVVSGGRRGRTKRIRPLLGEEATQKMLSEDAALSELA